MYIGLTVGFVVGLLSGAMLMALAGIASKDEYDDQDREERRS
jgi:hypothetical protein